MGPDGSLDRAALAAVVFADAAARARLNAIVHPRVRAEEARRAGDLAGRGAAVLVTDAALLVEAGAHLRFDRLVVVHCDPGQQLERLRARDGLDEAGRAGAHRGADAARGEARLRPLRGGHVGLGPRHGSRRGRARRGAASRSRGAGRDSRAVAVGALLGGLVHGPETGPRGLAPASLLAAAAEAGGLEMEGLGRRLTPPRPRPWYETAEEADPGAAAANLAVALAAWALCRGAADPPFLAGVAGSVARLTHTDAAARADACVLALVAQEVALAAGAPGDVEARARRLERLATRFGGRRLPAASPRCGRPSARVRATRPGRARSARAGAATPRWRGRSPGSEPRSRTRRGRGELRRRSPRSAPAPPERDARARHDYSVSRAS